MLALTHVPSPRMHDGQRTHVSRVAVAYDRAVRQHEAYRRMLQNCGAEVRVLDVNRDLPDCAFIEDTAVVLDEVAVLASMGTESRRAEPAGIEAELRRHRPICRIEAPATLEGGDVLRVGRMLWVGLSSRTNAEGAVGLVRFVHRFGYTVRSVPLQDCLHLKTACTALPDGSLLVNPAWLPREAVEDLECIPVPSEEPWAANTLSVGQTVCVSAAHPRMADLIRGRGLAVETIDLSEFAKMEGGITCLSLLL
jgi:dimethylargininase